MTQVIWGKDDSGNNTNGTLFPPPPQEGPVTIGGKIGGGIQLDGTDDAVSLGDHSSFEGVSAFSTGGWFKCSASCGYDTFISKYNGNYQGGPFILWTYAPSDALFFTVNTSPTTAGTAQFLFPQALQNDGKWHHLMGVYNNGNVKVYLDGVLGGVEGNIIGTPTSMTDVNNVWIGRSGGGSDSFSGTLDDFRFSAHTFT